jgi:hypothetical protein
MNKFKRWGYSRFGTKTYATKDEAKLALFDDFWAATQSFSVFDEQPIFAEIDTIACQREPCWPAFS